MLNLNSHEAEPNGNKKKLSVLIGVAVICGAFALSSTFAGNIGLNSGKPVEFGQGVASATACDNQITITPFSSFVNETGGGRHLLTSVKISGIDSSSSKCSGKTFLIKAYGDSGLLDILNYTDNYSDIDFNSIEILDTAGQFSWVSGGTDGDDLVNDENVGDPGRDLTDTSFTVNLRSVSNPVIRTALASAQEVKSITVETFDAGLLDGHILTSSQIGFLIPDYILQNGFDVDNSLPGGNFNASCTPPICAPYFTLNDWISNITVEDINGYNSAFGTSGLTRSQLSNAISFKFTYRPQEAPNSRWRIELVILGEVDSYDHVDGGVFGFDGHTGYFLSTDNGPSISLFFSLDSRLQSNSSIGDLIPYGDQLTRTLPIRNFLSVWNSSDAPYYEGQQ